MNNFYSKGETITCAATGKTAIVLETVPKRVDFATYVYCLENDTGYRTHIKYSNGVFF